MSATKALTIAVFWLLGPASLLAEEPRSITVRLPVDSSGRQGIEFANARSCINPLRQPASGGRRAWMTDRLIVKFRSDVTLAEIDSVEHSLGCHRESDEPNVWGFHFIGADSATGKSIRELCAEYASRGLCSLIVPEIVSPAIPRDDDTIGAFSIPVQRSVL